MKTARGAEGQRLFSHEEVLSAAQIEEFFSRRAKCRIPVPTSDKDYEDAANEDEMSELRNEVIDQVQPRHPLMYGGHNLCDLVAAQNLNKLTVAKLREICNSFDLTVDPPEAKRKAHLLPC